MLLGLAACGGLGAPDAPGDPEAPQPGLPPDAADASDAADAAGDSRVGVGRSDPATGLLLGPPAFPAVAGFGTLAAAGDSTLLLFAVTFPPSALQFRRGPGGFVADYVVSVDVARDTQRVRRADWRERVRVGAFAETRETRRTILFQGALTLEPGRYAVTVRVRNGLSARGFEATDTLTVPALDEIPALAPPVLAYEARPRAGVHAEPRLVLAPDRTVGYGGPDVWAYVERYGGWPGGERAVTVEARAPGGAVVWAATVLLEPAGGAGGEAPSDSEVPGAPGLRSAAVPLPVDSLPFGTYRLVAAADGVVSAPVGFRVTFAEEWIRSHFGDLVDLLAPRADAAAIAALRDAPPAERLERWSRFWAAVDPDPGTLANEPLDRFLERLRSAADRFGEGERGGWRTDRGRAYVLLGPPSRIEESRTDAALGERPNVQAWVYDPEPRGRRLRLVFEDRFGVGTYRLDEASEVALRDAVRRLPTLDPQH